MSKIIFIAFLIGLMSMLACKKDQKTSQNPSTNPILVADYFPMAIGNYWVYENHVNTNGAVEVINENDSIVIIGDTLINDKNYFIFESYKQPYNSPSLYFYRDSSNYIVDQNGSIIFTTENAGQVIFEEIDRIDADTVTYQSNYVDLRVNNVLLPAGNFEAISLVSDFIVLPHSDIADSLKFRHFESYFIDGIGRASNFLFFASGHKTYDKKLLRYHIE
jgi:hypothetical protein